MENIKKVREKLAEQMIPNQDNFRWPFYGISGGDYYVLELDPDYRFVLVGSKTDKFLWILSRTPQMEQKDLDYILSSARERGYDLSKLIWVEQRRK